MTRDKREGPLLRAGRRARCAAADAVRRGQAGATDETKAADEPETRTMRACIPSFMRHIAQLPAPTPKGDDGSVSDVGGMG